MQRIRCGGPSFCDHGKTLLRDCDECIAANRFVIVYECVSCAAKATLTYQVKLDWDWPLIIGWSLAGLFLLLLLTK